MEAPVAMATGGYVQRFSDGTDEDGVTPSRDTSSYPAGTFNQQQLAEARRSIAATLAQQPLAVPDIYAQTESRVPLYEKLLGVDKNLSQAQILFELGQRAFNYGANIDDQGRPLMGSQAARLAGAARTLPGSMGNILAQQAQQERAVKGAALQAAERDVQNIREQNIKLAATKQKLQSDMLKSASAGNKMFGSGLEGTAQALLVNLSPAYKKGETSADQDRMYESAVAIVTQPIQYTNPYTGNLETRIPNIPEHVKDALSARGKMSTTTPIVEEPALDALVPSGSAVAVAEPGSSDRAQQEDIARRFKTAKADFKAGKIPKAEYDTLVATLNEESKQVKASVEKTVPAEFSLWNIAKDFTGPSASVRAGVTSIPSLGGTNPEVTRARAYANGAINQIVAALGTTARFGNTERQQIKDDLGLTSSIFQDPNKFRERLIGLNEILTQEIANTKKVVSDKNVPVETRKDAEKSLTELVNAKKFVNIPTISSMEEARPYPVGSFFLYNGQIVEKKRKTN
jgi:hypothetical protein